MPLKITDDASGEEKEVYTKEELEAAQKTSAEEAVKPFSEKTAKLEDDLRKANLVLAEKTENFKRLNDMTKEEKDKMTAKEIESQKRIEAAEDSAKQLRDQIAAEKTGKITKAKEKAIAAFAGTDEKLKEKLLENYKIINLPETDEDDIGKRVEAAFNMTGAARPKINPLNQSWSGEAPNKGGSSENFAETDKGKEGLKKMGEIKF